MSCFQLKRRTMGGRQVTKCLWLACMVAIALAAGVVDPKVTSAAEFACPNWQRPINLSFKVNNDSTSSIPRIAADVEGNVHVAWSASTQSGAGPNILVNTVYY